MIKLTHLSGGQDVWVNPSKVIYLEYSPSRGGTYVELVGQETLCVEGFPEDILFKIEW